MNKEQKRKKIAIILNILLILMEIAGFLICITLYGYFDISYYTQDSNLFALIVSIIYLINVISKKEISKIVSVLKYISVLSLMVTFLVVIFILAPMYNFAYLYLMTSEASIFYHTLCPIIAIISFVFFEEHKIEGKKDILRATYFTMLYSIILIFLNIIGKVDGPYPFLRVRHNPIYMSIIWFIIIIGGAFGIGKIIEVVKRKTRITT